MSNKCKFTLLVFLTLHSSTFIDKYYLKSY